MSGFPGVAGVFAILHLLLVLGVLGISVYSLILFIKLANKGIQALDIYLDEKSKE